MLGFDGVTCYWQISYNIVTRKTMSDKAKIR